MNQRQLLLLFYTATSALTFAQDKLAADPPQLVAAREENIRAAQRALAPVLQNYVAKLTGLQQQRFGPRSQTPFGNALAGETLFHMEGVSAGASAAPPTDTPAWGTEFPSQGRSQTEFGNEGNPVTMS